MELLKVNGEAAIYSLDAEKELEGFSPEKLPWGRGISRLKIVFKDENPGECENVLKNGFPGFDLKLTYSARRSELEKVASGRNDGISLERPKDFEELKRLYQTTDEHYFYNRWKEFLTPAYLDDIKDFVDNDLPTSRSAVIKKNGETLGLINLVKWKDVFDIPVDWISWVWLSSKLTQEEKAGARVLFREWLAGETVETVQCVVNYFNVPSQKFFRKMGFVPACIHISKKS
jgi:hypothetical protein